jgi:hypothetical protein
MVVVPLGLLGRRRGGKKQTREKRRDPVELTHKDVGCHNRRETYKFLAGGSEAAVALSYSPWIE